MGEYGNSTVSEKNLTEDSLVNDQKVYANKIQIVYDVMIRNSGDEGYHTVPIVDEFLIKVNKTDKEE